MLLLDPIRRCLADFHQLVHVLGAVHVCDRLELLRVQLVLEPGYTLNTTSLVNTGNNNFDIGFDFSAPTGIVLPVLDPFSYSVDLGVLDAGDYSIMANFYVDSLLDNTISSTFTVSAVPVPAAIWLFFSGIISLFAYGIKSRNA